MRYIFIILIFLVVFVEDIIFCMYGGLLFDLIDLK